MTIEEAILKELPSLTFEEFKKLPADDDRLLWLSETLSRIPYRFRIAWTRENLEWLNLMTPDELDEVGRRCCHSSRRLAREQRPIIGDIGTSCVAQERFDNELFGYSQPLDEDIINE